MSGSFDFERSARSALPNEGFNDQPLTILGMFDASLAALSTSTAPEILATVTNGIVLKWDHGDTASSYIQIPFTIPDWYVQESDYIVLIVPARKVDSGGDENTDLCLQAQLYWQKPGQLNTPDQQSATATAPVAKTTGDTSQKSLTTPAKALMAGANTSAATSNTTGWFEYEINLGVRLHAEGKEISRGSLCNLRLGPNETVGSSDMDVEIGIPRLAIRRHARSDAFIERT
mgnify:CR=1 FL=1